ncbi:MAG: TRAP transporter small permease subunit, partial [Pseudomonadota bacterium]
PVRHMAHQVSHCIDRLSGGALTAAIAMALVMMFAQLAVVIARYAFGLAFTWLNEIVIYAFAAMFLLAAAGALRDDAHVRVDILRTRFGPRGLAAVELAGAYLFIIPICLLILWAAAPALTNAWARFEGSRESDGLPLLFLFKTLVPLFAVLLLTQGLSQAIKAALVLSGESAPDSEEVPGTSGAI